MAKTECQILVEYLPGFLVGNYHISESSIKKKVGGYESSALIFFSISIEIVQNSEPFYILRIAFPGLLFSYNSAIIHPRNRNRAKKSIRRFSMKTIAERMWNSLCQNVSKAILKLVIFAEFNKPRSKTEKPKLNLKPRGTVK
ncbi:hypothetical protein HELRODRAFT_162571 [Helobdella robusta]|uniref:Uncharacterized protein n=1 Tax=Helobdella robusta TaxID=6412 RepID=T1ESU6_HELRO|nr:hypothetical protein HELRODRAFT_162571 [Helobdella robusta]ESN99084.1 hypothetical protein HELRODRAFT_162571 [Helobdella robusta]